MNNTTGYITKRFLTPAELQLIDPTGCGRAFLARFVDGAPTPSPVYLTRSPRELINEYLARRSKWCTAAKHSVVARYDDAHISKVGPQGDSFSMEEVQECYRRMYEFAHMPHSFDIALTGRNYFLQLLRTRIQFTGYPQPMYEERNYDPTGAALPTMLKKGDFVAETFGAKPYRHVQPMLPGQRSQRQKHRVINQDSVVNVRYFEKELKACRNWLKTQFPEYFSAWLRPDVYMTPRITRTLLSGDSYCVEIDFKACDEHTSFDLVKEIVLPIYEILIPSETVFVEFAAYVEELFHQPIFFGDTLWEGLHNLFSGQNITNDFETLYDVCLQLGALIVNSVRPETMVMLSLGDDQALAGRITRKQAEQIMRTLVDEARLNGHEIQDSKCGIEKDVITFCRKVYYAAGPKDSSGNLYGAYPTILCLNNIVYPEKFQPDTVGSRISVLQRLDGAVGTPWCEPFIQFVGSHMRWGDCAFAPDDTVLIQDWWSKVYGEKWTCGNSEAFRILKKSGILK